MSKELEEAIDRLLACKEPDFDLLFYRLLNDTEFCNAFIEFNRTMQGYLNVGEDKKKEEIINVTVDLGLGEEAKRRRLEYIELVEIILDDKNQDIKALKAYAKQLKIKWAEWWEED
jgi:hypothetical protein